MAAYQREKCSRCTHIRVYHGAETVGKDTTRILFIAPCTGEGKSDFGFVYKQAPDFIPEGENQAAP